MKKLIFIFMACLVTYGLQAQTYTWTGNGITDAWDNPQNWSPNTGFPSTSNDNAIITFGTPFLTGTYTIKKLQVSGGADLDLSNYSLTVTGELNVYNSGTTVFGTGTLTVNNGSNPTQIQISAAVSCPVDITSSNIYLRNSIFYGPVFIKQAGGTSSNQGGNTFHNTVNITLQSNGSFSLGNTSYSGDIFNDVVTVNNTGTGTLTLGNTLASGTCTLNSYIVAGIYSNGYLTLQKFAQVGSMAQSLTLTTNAKFTTRQATFAATLSVTAPWVDFGGSTFASAVSATQTGTGTCSMDGGNSFQSTLALTNQASGTMIMHYNNNDTYNGNVTVNNTGGGTLKFGENGGIGHLQPTADLLIGSFGSGTLWLKDFKQHGSSNPQTITLGGSCLFRTSTSTEFEGVTTISSPLTNIGGTRFHTTSYITNTGLGSTAQIWDGANRYDGDVTITNSASSSSATLTLTLNAGSMSPITDQYNANAKFVRSSGAADINIGMGYMTAIFKGDVEFENIQNLQLYSHQYCKFIGGATQHVKASNAATIIIGNILMNKTIGTEVVLDDPIEIRESCYFTTGRMVTTNSDIVTFAAGSVATNPSNNSYIDGPARKQGNTDFTFPIGKSNLYRPVRISGYSTSGSEFEAEYMIANPATTSPYNSTTDGTFIGLSTCEYWELTSNSGTATVTVIPTIGSNTCNFSTDVNMRVVGWDGSLWKNYYNSGTAPVFNTNGGIISSVPQPTYYQAFTLANNCNNASVSISPSGPISLCEASLVLTASSSSSYSWTEGGDPTVIGTSQTLTVDHAGVYHVAITDNTGCTGTANVTVNVCCDDPGTLGTTQGTGTPSNESNFWTGGNITGTLAYDGLIRNEQGIVDCDGIFFINGDFIVNGNFTFQDVCVGISPKSRIIVNANCTLRLDNAHLFACSDAMWGGIVLADASSHLDVINNTLIEDAERAIDVSGGTYAIDHGNFNKNFISIFSTDNTNTVGDIRASRFLCYQTGSLNSTWVDSDLKSPYVGEHSFIGIVSIGSGGTPTITVGGVATSQGCKFANLYNGIFGFQSNVISHYNTFENLVAPAWAFPGETQPAWALPYMLTPPFLPMANGIFIDTETSTPISLNIPYQNKFNNCYAGVNVGRNTDTYVANCKFNDDVLGIALNPPTYTGRTTDLHANEFKRNAVAIWSKNLNGSTVDIYSNDINGNGAPVNTFTPTTLGWGIYNTQQYLAGSDTRIDIHANTITDVQYGIKVENWDNGLNRIESNIITVDESSSLASVDEGAGIWGAALYDHTLIAENTITGPDEHNGDLSGISLSSSNAILQCNTMQDLDNGILTKSGTGNVLVYKNTITNNTNGIFADSDGPSEIGASTSASDNEWTSNTCDVYSNFSASAYTVYTRSSVSPFLATICSNSSPTNDYGYDDTAPISPLYSCGVVKSLSDEDSLLVSQLRQLSNRIAMGEISSMDNKEEQFWNIQYGAYTRLVGNANAYNFADDILIANYTAADNGNIGKLYSAITYLGSNNADSLTAQQHYNTIYNIAALNKSEQTLKSYVLLQLNRVAHPRFIVSAFNPIAQTAFQMVNPGMVYSPLYSTDLKYTPAEEQTLDSLATLCPSSHGVGVYMARAALSFKQVMFTSSCELSTTTATVENSVSGIAIYPNPSTGNVFVKLPSGVSNTKIQLFSSAGALLQSATVTGQLVELNMDVYANGLYIIRILDSNGNLLDTKKVSLVK